MVVIRVKIFRVQNSSCAKEHILLCENGFILAPSKKNFCQPKNKKKFFISEVLPKGVASIQLSKIQKLQLEQYFQENPNWMISTG